MQQQIFRYSAKENYARGMGDGLGEPRKQRIPEIFPQTRGESLQPLKDKIIETRQGKQGYFGARDFGLTNFQGASSVAYKPEYKDLPLEEAFRPLSETTIFIRNFLQRRAILVQKAKNILARTEVGLDALIRKFLLNALKQSGQLAEVQALREEAQQQMSAGNEAQARNLMRQAEELQDSVINRGKVAQQVQRMVGVIKTDVDPKFEQAQQIQKDLETEVGEEEEGEVEMTIQDELQRAFIPILESEGVNLADATILSREMAKQSLMRALGQQGEGANLFASVPLQQDVLALGDTKLQGRSASMRPANAYTYQGDPNARYNAQGSGGFGLPALTPEMINASMSIEEAVGGEIQMSSGIVVGSNEELNGMVDVAYAGKKRIGLGTTPISVEGYSAFPIFGENREVVGFLPGEIVRDGLNNYENATRQIAVLNGLNDLLPPKRNINVQRLGAKLSEIQNTLRRANQFDRLMAETTKQGGASAGRGGMTEEELSAGLTGDPSEYQTITTDPTGAPNATIANQIKGGRAKGLGETEL